MLVEEVRGYGDVALRGDYSFLERTGRNFDLLALLLGSRQIVVLLACKPGKKSALRPTSQADSVCMFFFLYAGPKRRESYHCCSF